jgi:DNA-binding transcriptional MerR regulator
MRVVSDEPAEGPHLLTIGQLAGYAGVTIKAVRHYHRRGLLPEPPRDASGYRRYSARHAIDLVKIKTLADAGVPLARVKDLLVAGGEQFTAAIAEIDRDLRRQAEKIRRSRERIAQLHAGERLFVSERMSAYLDRLREIGVSENSVRLERDLWILMHSVWPEEAEGWIEDKLEALEEPEFRALYLAHDEAFGWSPDDPRLPALAERTRRWMSGREPEDAGGDRAGAAIAELAAASVAASSPAWDRLFALAKG